MQFHAGQALDLVDSRQRLLGTVQVDSVKGTLVSGRFGAGAGFAEVAELFHRFDEAVDAQALVIVDKLDRGIAALGLQLRIPGSTVSECVHDVQIYADRNFSCRVTVPVATNGPQGPAASRKTA